MDEKTSNDQASQNVNQDPYPNFPQNERIEKSADIPQPREVVDFPKINQVQAMPAQNDPSNMIF